MPHGAGEELNRTMPVDWPGAFNPNPGEDFIHRYAISGRGSYQSPWVEYPSG